VKEAAGDGGFFFGAFICCLSLADRGSAGAAPAFAI